MVEKQSISLVSVIVPVYKAEAYLSNCVDSILRQTFRNFELILVDDGSPDGSGVVCDNYEILDSRVRVIHKENGGVSSARNLAISLACGEYIVFIDSDDYVGENYLQDLLSVAEEGTLIISDYQPFREDGKEQRKFFPEFSVDLDAGNAESFRRLIFEFQMFPPYCKLYRRKIIMEHEIRFDTEMKSAEDFDFNMRYLQHVSRITYIPSVQYFYRIGYKAYVPSNAGVLGWSEIKSVHTMARGMVSLAKRMGCFDELEDEICLWAAKKHYFNRLPMLFAVNPRIGYRERKMLYRQLLSNEIYRNLHKRGIRKMGKSTTRQIGTYFDRFPMWWLFYKINEIRSRRH